MDFLLTLRVFKRVAESGSFSAIAREMGTTQPAVSRQIAALESHLGVRLLHRTTRSLTLTEDGRDLLAHADRVLGAVEETLASVGGRRSNPSGLVRIGSSTSFGRLHVAPRLATLLDRYPELHVELCLSDSPVDLVHEGLDVSVRIGAVPDSSLIARRVGLTKRVCVASAEYLGQRGEPTHPDALREHACIVFTHTGPVWAFDGADGAAAKVEVGGRFRTDSGEALRAAVLAGMGIARAGAWLFRDQLLDGTVREVLPGWQSPLAPIYAVYPTRRHLAPRTRAVIDFLAEEFRLDPALSTYGQPE